MTVQNKNYQFLHSSPLFTSLVTDIVQRKYSDQITMELSLETLESLINPPGDFLKISDLLTSDFYHFLYNNKVKYGFSTDDYKNVILQKL